MPTSTNDLGRGWRASDALLSRHVAMLLVGSHGACHEEGNSVMLITASELTSSPGKSGQLGPLVAQMRDVLGKASGRDWYAWAVVTGRPYGSFMLSTRFDDLPT